MVSRLSRAAEAERRLKFARITEFLGDKRLFSGREAVLTRLLAGCCIKPAPEPVADNYGCGRLTKSHFSAGRRLIPELRAAFHGNFTREFTRESRLKLA